MRRGTVDSLLPVLVLLLLPAWQRSVPRPRLEGSSRTYTVAGTLRYTDSNQSAEMIKVELRHFSGEPLNTTFTNSNGDFQFSGLAGGSYYLVVEEPGYEPLREAVELIRGDRRGVALFLSRVRTLRAAHPPEAVSARELSLPPKAREAFQKGMQRFWEKDDPKGAIVQFQHAIAQLPGYYEAYLQMGLAYQKLGQTDEAEQAFRKSIELSSNAFADPHFALASLLCSRQKFVEAEASARRGLAIDPNSWRGYFRLAQALFELDRLAEAEKNILEAKKRKPDYAELNLLSANVHIRTNDYPALLKDLDDYLRLEPNGPKSQQAREMRADIQKKIATAENAPATSPPKP